MTVTIRTGADVWAEVLTDQGRFYVPFDASVFDLVQQIIRGGHWVHDMTSGPVMTHNSGKGHLGKQK